MVLSAKFIRRDSLRAGQILAIGGTALPEAVHVLTVPYFLGRVVVDWEGRDVGNDVLVVDDSVLLDLALGVVREIVVSDVGLPEGVHFADFQPLFG
jgi:hypothetical protein